MPKKGLRDKIEWNLLFGGCVLLAAWLFLALPFLNDIADASPAEAYALFLVGVLGFGALVGSSVHQSRQAALVFLSIVLITGIIMPSMVIRYDVPPTRETLSIWGADTGVYSLFLVLGLGHHLTWLLTYYVTPVACFFVLLYYLSGKKLTDKLMVILNGG